MNPSIGIDIVEIERFKEWHTYSDQMLYKVFSSQEIDFCKSIPIKSSERFATRFAAKEAFFKAIAAYAIKNPPLLSVFKSIEVIRNGSSPCFRISWHQLSLHYKFPASELQLSLSLSHSKNMACAVVVTHSFICKTHIAD